jgi:hypothetical protein
MARRKRSSPILDNAQIRLAGVKSIRDKEQLGPRLSVDAYEQRIIAFAAKLSEYNGMLAGLDQMLNDLQRDERELQSESVRMLAGIGAHFGPDSSEYEQAGGTRKSERKRPVRKPKPKKDDSGNDS